MENFASDNQKHVHGYDRTSCVNCICASCYKQEFCDHCSSCEDHSRKKEKCDGYEGAFNY